MKPIILITGGISFSVTGKPQWALNHSYHECITEAGGIQTMNTYFGGVNHEVKMKKDSILGNLFGESMLINSYHHQVIEELAPGFVATAWSDAGGHEIIEAMEHESLPYWGVQWHPESMSGEVTNPVECVDSIPIFKCFVEQCKK